MLRNIVGFFVVFLNLFAAEASVFYPVSDSHRSVALEVFVLKDGLFESLEETYEALRTFEILGIEKKAEMGNIFCKLISLNLNSSLSLKNIFYALKVNDMVKCNIKENVIEEIHLKLKASLKDASSLFEFLYSSNSLLLIKDRASVILTRDEINGALHSIKALSQSGGMWRYGSTNLDTSTAAAGVAFEALSGIILLSSYEMDQTLISSLKNDMTELFRGIKSYDDGTFYFSEKLTGEIEHRDSVFTSYTVVRGFTSFSNAISGNLNIPGYKILGLAKFFLGLGIPENVKDFYHQIESLYFLENNRISTPLILSPVTAVLSLNNNDQLKVNINTALGSHTPSVSVMLLEFFSPGSKGSTIACDKKLKYDKETRTHYLEILPENIDVGIYSFVFESVFQDPEDEKVYTIEGKTEVMFFVTGIININSAKVSVLDADLDTMESYDMVDLAGQTALSLSANHLQKLNLCFKLSTPKGRLFSPHQVFLKLKHESKVEHLFVIKNQQEKFEIQLDFLVLVEKFSHLSGKYGIELSIGDFVMENSFVHIIGQMELDLPGQTEKETQPPTLAADPYLRFEPKAEINHIFRSPEKQPPKELSLAFFGFTLLPLVGLLIGLFRIGSNLKNFPSASIASATFAFLFHSGIAAVLLLYGLFWLKLDLFTTLKALGFIAVFLFVVGHRTLSQLAFSSSSKQKSA